MEPLKYQRASRGTRHLLSVLNAISLRQRAAESKRRNLKAAKKIGPRSRL